MSHVRIRRFAALIALQFAIASPVLAQCSSDTVRGTWAWQNQGTVMLPVPGYPMPVPVPFVSQGVMDVGALGNLALHATLSVGGQVQDVDGVGSIVVKRDCTVTVTDSLGSTALGMILDHGREMRLMTTVFPLGPSTSMARFRLITRGDPRCTNATVRGLYRGSAAGTFMIAVPGQPQPAPMPFSGLFTMAFDGNGGGTATAIASMGGTPADVTFSDISMVVNRDCTATLRYRGVVQQIPDQVFSGAIKYVVLGHGEELLGMEVESSVGLPLELEQHQRVSRVPPGIHR